MKLRDGVIVAAFVLIAAWAWRWDGVKEGERKSEEKHAAQLVTVRRTVTDSLFAQQSRQLDSVDAEWVKLVGQRDSLVRSARARTDTVFFEIAPSFADSALTIIGGDTLVPLRRVRRFVATLAIRLAEERAAEDSAKLARDSLHADELQLIRHQRLALADTLKAERNATDAAIKAAIVANRPSFVKQWGERILWAGFGFALGSIAR